MTLLPPIITFKIVHCPWNYAISLCWLSYVNTVLPRKLLKHIIFMFRKEELINKEKIYSSNTNLNELLFPNFSSSFPNYLYRKQKNSLRALKFLLLLAKQQVNKIKNYISMCKCKFYCRYTFTFYLFLKSRSIPYKCVSFVGFSIEFCIINNSLHIFSYSVIILYEEDVLQSA